MAEPNGKIIIKGGHVVDPSRGLDGPADLLIVGANIEAVDKPGAIPGHGAVVVDATGKYVAPGFIDMHVHLREPGYEYKETIASGCRSAVVGGVTSLACMANTDPVNDNSSVTRYILEKAKAAALANVFPIGAVSVGLKGENLAEFGEMFEAGIVAVSDDGQPIMDSGLMRRALEYACMFDFPVIAHEEDKLLGHGGVMNEGVVSVRLGLPGLPTVAEAAMVARDVELVRYTNARLHVAHVSTAESVAIIRRAKEEGLRVSAEAAPHHFVLDESAVAGYNTNAKMYPPLRTSDDVEAVRCGLADGSIDTIASDHAPHHRDEKIGEFDRAAFGIVGLETLLPLSLGLMRDGVFSLSDMVEALSLAPARNLNLDRGTLAPGAVADVVVFDPEIEWTLKSSELASKSSNTPFEGWPMKGRACLTLVAGRQVWAANGQGVEGE
ncbi:MAG: dihydroorotase [Deltaproteobacteria bacterium]